MCCSAGAVNFAHFIEPFKITTAVFRKEEGRRGKKIIIIIIYIISNYIKYKVYYYYSAIIINLLSQQHMYIYIYTLVLLLDLKSLALSSTFAAVKPHLYTYFDYKNKLDVSFI